MVFPFYAATAAIVFFLLNITVIIGRRRYGIAYGDAGNDLLLRLRSMYFNYLEFTGIYLFLLLACESLSVEGLFLHTLSISFFTARGLHILSVLTRQWWLRVSGIFISHLCILTLSIKLLLTYA